MKKIIALMLALLMCTFCLVGCTKDAGTETPDEPTVIDENPTESEETEEPTAPKTDLEQIIANGVLVVGITDFAPMDYQDAAGNWIGFDADMAKAFASYLGVDVEFQVIEWDNKVMELNSKTIDVVWNGMTLTDEVVAAMECSNAYCNNAQVIILPTELVDTYTTLDSMNELVFAVEAGSAGEAQATAAGLATLPVLDQQTALLEVASGNADAAVIDSLMAGAMVGEGTSYESLTYTLGLNSEEYGVGFRKGSDAAAKLNEFFAAAYADGSMMQIAEAYGVQAAIINQ